MGALDARRVLRRGAHGARLGARGHVEMRFHPTGRLRRFPAASCRGRLRGRGGALRGTFVVHAGRRLGTIRRHRLAEILTGDHEDCSDPSPMGGDYALRFGSGGVSGLVYDLEVAAKPSVPVPSTATLEGQCEQCI